MSLLHLRNKELYSSWSKLTQVEIAHGAAVVTTPFDGTFGKCFFHHSAPDIQRILHVSRHDHSAATLTTCSPIHFIGHLSLAAVEHREMLSRAHEPTAAGLEQRQLLQFASKPFIFLCCGFDSSIMNHRKLNTRRRFAISAALCIAAGAHQAHRSSGEGGHHWLHFRHDGPPSRTFPFGHL